VFPSEPSYEHASYEHAHEHAHECAEHGNELSRYDLSGSTNMNEREWERVGVTVRVKERELGLLLGLEREREREGRHLKRTANMLWILLFDQKLCRIFKFIIIDTAAIINWSLLYSVIINWYPSSGVLT
jgi:hypothetical protein